MATVTTGVWVRANPHSVAVHVHHGAADHKLSPLPVMSRQACVHLSDAVPADQNLAVFMVVWGGSGVSEWEAGEQVG